MFNNTDSNLESLNVGAFLTSGNDPCNVMTIGWGAVGIMWRKPIFIAPLRASRYTRELIEKTKTFAVSIPRIGEFKQELALCGSKSGRKFDKIATLRTHRATKIDTLLIDNCENYYECRTLAAIPIEEGMMDESVLGFYKDHDYHYLYIGEIL